MALSYLQEQRTQFILTQQCPNGQNKKYHTPSIISITGCRVGRVQRPLCHHSSAPCLQPPRDQLHLAAGSGEQVGSWGQAAPALLSGLAWVWGLTAVLLAGALREVKRLSKDPAAWEGASWRPSQVGRGIPPSCWLLAQALPKLEKQFARA